MNEFERRKREAETVEIVSEVVVDDRARRQGDHARHGAADADASGDAGRFGSRGFDGSGAGGNGPRGPYDGGFGAAGGSFQRGPQNADEVATLRTLSHILYALYVISLFTAGVAGIVAVIIDYVRRSAMRGTLYESHSAWRTRTFWWALVGNMIGWSLWWSHLGAGLLVVVWIWYIYRCGKGWLRLLESKPVSGRWI
ncbi:hypothetical protein [Robbsia sp. KACC 23696]|uniref:DUF4870 family protein n=1 Tax=Robbsia sp. KACC 23696 TaxID=3149231 RepID=UPI00325A8795